MMEGTLESRSLADRLNDPQTNAALHRLLDRAESLDRVLEVAEQVPNLLAAATDVFDSLCKQASEQGIDLEARAAELLTLLEKLTSPESTAALGQLIERLPQLANASQMLDELPKLVAIAIDVFDEWANELKEDGIDLEQSLRQGLRAALWLGGQIRTDELGRLGYLLKSDVLAEHSVETVGMAGSALASCRRGTCEHPVPKRVGMLGVLAAMRDPNTQRAVAFGLQFAKCFGGILQEKRDHGGGLTTGTTDRQTFQPGA
jgi:uncharacterized protein YjgD (DUF1641 family)